MSFSEMNSLKKELPSTASTVAMPWPAMVPVTTPAGKEATASAMVEKNDLSPYSAMNTNTNVATTVAWSPTLLSLATPTIANSASYFSSLALDPSMDAASTNVDTPKYTNSTTAAKSSYGNCLAPKLRMKLSKYWNARPNATEITIIAASAPKVPAKIARFNFHVTNSATMKNVLSPISEKKISRNADEKPL